MSPQRLPVVITCEHGGNVVPREYRAIFAGAEDVLASHRGWDPGALEVGKALARAAGASLVHATTTRLLVDLNRTEDGAGRFSEFTRNLPPETREKILRDHYAPHWAAAREAVTVARSLAHHGMVLHVASHSFTALPGRIGGRLRSARTFTIGLLYDPLRGLERAFAEEWRRAILNQEPRFQILMNRPYRGWTDGMTRTFRREFGVRYMGIELECNQSSLAVPETATRLRSVLSATLAEVAGRSLRS